MADILLSVGLQAASASSDAFKNQVEQIVKKMSWQSLPKVEVGVAVSKDSLSVFKQQLTEIMNGVTLGSGQQLVISLGGDLGKVKTEIKDLEQAHDRVKKKLSEKIKLQIDTGSIDAKIREYDQLKSKSDVLNNAVRAMQDAASVVKDTSASDSDRAKAYERYAEAAKIAANEIRNLAKAEKEEAAVAKKKASDDSKQIEMRKRLTDAIRLAREEQDKMRAAGKTGTTEYNNLSAAIKEAQDALDSGDIDAASAAMQRLGLSMSEAKASIQQFGQSFSALQSRFVQMFGAAGVIMFAVKQIKEMVKAATDIDTSMTQLRIVTNASEADYAAYGKTVSRTAKDISASMTDLIDSTTTYARLGYSLSDSGALAKYTAMLQNVGDIDVSSAQDAITAITKAFKIDASQIETIMNKMVIVGNNYPISVAQIAEGMNNAGSAMYAAGNSFDQSVALLTAANTTVQNISKSSTGLRTIAARIRNTKTELDDLGETIETAKYEEVIKNLTKQGVSLTGLNGEYRSTYDILKDIAAVWDDLSSMEQAAIAQQLAGTRQQNVFYSIIEQFQEASGAMQDMQNSTGALSAAYGEYLDSIQAHTDRFKATFQSMASEFVNSDLINGIVDIGTFIVSGIEKVSGLFDGLGGSAIVSAITGLAAAKFLPGVIEDWTKFFAGFAKMGTGGWIGTAIAAALPLIIAGVTKLKEAYDEAHPTLERINGEIAQAKSNISAYSREIDSNTERISELNKLDEDGGLSNSERNELNYLENRNSLLNEQLLIQEKLMHIKQQDAYNKAADEIETFLAGANEFSITKNTSSQFYSEGNDLRSDGIDYLHKLTDEYKEYNKKLSELPEDSNERSEYVEKIADISGKINDLYDQYSSQIDTLLQSGDQSKIELAQEMLNEFSEVISLFHGTRGDFEVFKNSVGGIPKDATSKIKELGENSEITGEQIKGLREESEEFDKWASQFNYGTAEETNNTIALYLTRVMDSIAANESAIESEQNRVKSLLSLQDELDETSKALNLYKSAIESGNNGDALKGYAEAYQALISEFEAGRYNSKVSRAAIDLLLPDDVLASLDYDMKAAGEMLSNGFFRAVFDGGEDYALNFVSVMHDIFGDEANSYFSFTENEDGTLDVMISDYQDLANILGVDVEFVYALADALSAYSDTAVMSKSDTEELAKTLGFDSYLNVGSDAAINIERISTAISHLSSLDGASFMSVMDGLKALEKGGYINLDGIENIGEQINSAISAAEESKMTIECDDKATPVINSAVDTLHKANGESAVMHLTTVAKTVDGGNIKTSAVTRNEIPRYAKASGTKNAQGGDTLVNELGPELINDNGHVYIAGNGEPTVTKLHKGAIVLTAEETKAALGGRFRNVPKRGAVAGTRINTAVNMTDSGYVDKEKQKLRIKERELKQLVRNYVYGSTSGKGSTGGGGGVGGGGSSAAAEVDDWFAREYAEHQHMLKMDQESQQDYLNWLNDAYKRAYDQNLIELKDYNKYQEEVYKGHQDVFKDYLGDQEHLIGLEEAGDNNPAVILNFYQNLINSVEKELDDAHARGLDSSNDYVQALQNKWISYTNAVKDLNEDADKEAKESVKDLVDYRIKMLKQYIKDEQNALKDRLSYLKDFYSKQKEMLQDVYDTEKYLDEQAEKRKSVTELEAQIEQLRFDNSAAGQKRLLKLQEDLAKAQKDLADFEKDHALDTAQDQLDKLYESQEEVINKRLDELDARLNDPKGLYEQALSDVQNNSVALYQEMIEFNNRVGSGIETDIIDKWEEAYVSLKKYHDVYGEYYKDINLVNATGWYPGKDNAWSRKVPVGGYASGTGSAKAGVHRVDENGAEWLFTSKDGNHYRLFSGGEKVLNAKATDFLYHFASNGSQILKSLASRATSPLSYPAMAMSGAPTIEMGDIIIQGNADQRTVSEIRRAQRDAVTSMLKEFGKLNKN